MPFLWVLAILIIVVSLIASRHAALRYQSALAHASLIRAPKARTGAEVARVYLESEGITDVEVVIHQALVTDYFDPKRRRLFLSPQVAKSTSIAAWAVALHEAAHAVQHRDSPSDVAWRQNCIRLTRYGPTFVVLLLAILAVVKVIHPRIGLIIFGIIWSLIFIFNIGSLAIEWNANLRLRRFLEQELSDHPDALDQIQNVLRTVATHEVGDLIRSPRYFFLSALPGTSKIRPTEKEPPPES